MKREDFIYYLMIPTKPIYSHIIYNLQSSGTPTKGPALMVAPHLFATDPFDIGMSVPERIVPTYITPKHMRKGREFTHVLATIFGIESTSPTFRNKLYEAYDQNSILLAFPEGDVPRKARRLAVNGYIHPYSVHVRMWSPTIFEYSCDYERLRGREITYQPVGLDHGEDVNYFPWCTFPALRTHTVVHFGEPQHSNGRNSLIFANEVMKEATELSGRHYDDNYFKRVMEHKNITV